MALDTSHNPTTDVKPAHPQPPAVTDATHEQDTKKADAPIGGGLAAATLAEVRKLVAAVEKPFSSDGNTLTFTPLDHADTAKDATAKDATAKAATAKPAETSAGKTPVGDKTSTATDKAHTSPATGEKTAVTGTKAGTKTGSDTPVAVPAPAPAAAPENAAGTAPTKPVVQPGQAATTDFKGSGTDGSTDASATTPDPNATKSIWTTIGETIAGDLGVPKGIVDTVEDAVGAAWNAAGNYATDLLSDSNLQKSMVSTSTDGQVQIDQQKASQVIDMQAIKNVFQGASGNQHIDQVNKMFSQASFHNPDADKRTGDASTETAAYKALDAQRTQMLTEHKPGDSWSDKNGVYSLDASGNLLEVTGTADNRDIKWIGQNGQSYEKDPSGNETWTKDGREIKQVGNGKFEFKDEFGNTTSIDGPAGITVRRVAEGTITSYNQNRTAITRQAAAQLNDGISTNPNAALYSHHDADGNQLIKDSLVHGETVFAKDGQTYRIHDGQVFIEDQYGNEQKTALDKLPAFIKRLDNGNLQFDDISIDKKDFMTASDHNTKMADKKAVITAGPADHPLTVKAGNGDVTITKPGEFTATSHTDAKTGVTTQHQVSASGQNEFDYNSKTGTMAGDGITFTKNGSHIRGTSFAVSSRGQIESASSWDAQNYASGINDASDAYILRMNDYDGSSSDSSGNGDGSTNGNGGSQDGSGDGSNQGSDADSADAPDSYQEYDKEKDREEKKNEKELSMWDALQAKFEAQANKTAEDTGVNKWRDDIKSGKLFELPESWKVASIKDSVNVSGLESSIARADHGTVDTGDVSSIEAVKAQLGSAASKFGFDADGYLAKLDGIEAKVEREVRVKAALQEVGVDASQSHMWSVYQHGGTVKAASELEERESA
jgi:hypothetical protein